MGSRWLPYATVFWDMRGRAQGICLQFKEIEALSLALDSTDVESIPLNIMDYLLIALKLIVSLGILNVWLLRRGKATSYRGKDAKNLREEFAVYGLPFPFYCFIGILKVSLALGLLASIWIPSLTQPAAVGMGVLMLGAFAMHLKVKDPISKALPSLVVLSMCAAIALL